jgi:hypothetical protein
MLYEKRLHDFIIKINYTRRNEGGANDFIWLGQFGPEGR